MTTRGFFGRRRVPEESAERLPPGQYYEQGFPILTAGPTPRVPTSEWTFSIEGLVAEPRSWGWDEARALPGSEFEGDIHCVTRWSKLGTSFAGVSVDTLLDAVGVKEAATHVLAFCYGGYTTNLPLEDVRGGKAWVAWEHEGRPLPAEHGGPARLLVPHLYFWKSAKWVKGLRLLDHDERGFWENYGYHDYGDPWREQRFRATESMTNPTDAPPRPIPWQTGVVTSIRIESPRAKSFRLTLPEWRAHLPGQYYTLRLSAPDGYEAIRSYSIASSPLDEGEIELTVDCLMDGEVSPFLHDVVQIGDELEVRGPLTEYFTWRGSSPLRLIGGGSGIVPLMSMLRHRRRALPHVPAQLLYSVRSPDDVFYRDELGDETTLTFTRRTPPGWTGATGRIDIDMITRLTPPDGIAYVCGPHSFVETAARLLMQAGYGTERIRTERFGPS